MIFTITDEQIRLFYPNVLLPAKGEQPLSEKLFPFLEGAEEWVIDTFCGNVVYNAAVAAENEDLEGLLHIALAVIVHEAMRRAIPELDLVLTPNGFGIVSNNTIAPASKERVERLIAQSVENRDLAIEAMLRRLIRLDIWKNSEQFEFFSSTLFPNIDVCRLVGRKALWEGYLDLRIQTMAVEERLAVQFFSHELMNALRAEITNGLAAMSAPRRHVVAILRTYIVEMLKGGNPDGHTLIDLVDFIRNRPDVFPEWESSETALLFSPPVFVNKKSNSGYFF